ncbi:MAG: aspartate aminotransferase family protein [Lewinella sp.]|uniref:aspartate aminotransferase family protein n=1 Tax=Lewinella sp. TaxID=2004506 RepID=UPI003D6A570F
MPNLRQLFLAHVAQTSDFPLGLEIASSEGMYLYDRQGKAYLDLIAGIGVSSLGHRHPKVVNAAKAQLDKYLHTIVYGEFVLAPQVQLASLIAKQLPAPLDSVYFTNSGTEATEGAMKLAKRYTGRHEFVSATHSYHGSSQGAASLMWPKDFTQAFHPLLPGIKHIEFNSDACLSKITTKTAAVILETVQAEWGLRRPRKAWLQAVRQRCNEVGALLILDEIQAGYGRTGTLWAFEQYGVVPDILLIAKGMGGGMPIGAFVAPKAIMHTLASDPILGHITTFGGHPVSTAAGLATLQAILEENLIAQVPAKEQLFLELLQHPRIVEVRSAGLWLAVELASFNEVQTVIKHCLENGLITDWFLFNDRSLRIAPPLIITEEEIRKACAIVLKGIEQL